MSNSGAFTHRRPQRFLLCVALRCVALLRLTKADLLSDANVSDGLADALLGALQAAKLLSVTGIVELAIDDAHILAAPVAAAFGAELAAKATQIVHVVKRSR